MRQTALFFLLLTLLTGVFSACAAPQADESLSTPVDGVGFVTIKSGTTLETISLRARPDLASDIIDNLQPGESGDLLGTDSSGLWLLVEFNGKRGWLPLALVTVTKDY